MERIAAQLTRTFEGAPQSAIESMWGGQRRYEQLSMDCEHLRSEVVRLEERLALTRELLNEVSAHERLLQIKGDGLSAEERAEQAARELIAEAEATTKTRRQVEAERRAAMSQPTLSMEEKKKNAIKEKEAASPLTTRANALLRQISRKLGAAMRQLKVAEVQAKCAWWHVPANQRKMEAMEKERLELHEFEEQVAVAARALEAFGFGGGGVGSEAVAPAGHVVDVPSHAISAACGDEASQARPPATPEREKKPCALLTHSPTSVTSVDRVDEAPTRTEPDQQQPSRLTAGEQQLSLLSAVDQGRCDQQQLSLLTDDQRQPSLLPAEDHYRADQQQLSLLYAGVPIQAPGKDGDVGMAQWWRLAWRGAWSGVVEQLESVLPLVLAEFAKIREIRRRWELEEAGYLLCEKGDGTYFAFPDSDFVVAERRVGKGRQRGQGRVGKRMRRSRSMRTRGTKRGTGLAVRGGLHSPVPTLRAIGSTATLRVSVDLPVQERQGEGWSVAALARYIARVCLSESRGGLGHLEFVARAEAKRARDRDRSWDLEIPDFFFWSLWCEWGDLKQLA